MSTASPNALTAYLAEYNVLTAEIYTRFESQRLSFTLTVTLLGAVVAALTQGRLSGDAPTAVLLAVPVFIAPAAAIFFDNEIMIYRLANRIVNVIQPDVAALVGEPRALAGHEYGLGGIRRFTQHGLSFTRWILFVTGPIVATLLLATQPASYPIRWPLERAALHRGLLSRCLAVVGDGRRGVLSIRVVVQGHEPQRNVAPTSYRQARQRGNEHSRVLADGKSRCNEPARRDINRDLTAFSQEWGSAC